MTAQIRGMLLEEAILYLLRYSGYIPVEYAHDDETLEISGSGLKVVGRGESHQIDAIGDYSIRIPFTYPQRLLIEAKFLNAKVSLSIIRNALGVLKDVQEYWVPSHKNLPVQKRFHYQYAVFSAQGYTIPAFRYAFAQDIYLIQLEKSTYFRPIIESISPFNSPTIWGNNPVKKSVSMIRKAVRKRLHHNNNSIIENLEIPDEASILLTNFIDSIVNINGAVIAFLENNLPLFLVPSNQVNLEDLSGEYIVRIYRDNLSWYIREINDGDERDLFSFDLPDELLNMYQQNEYLSPLSAIILKREQMAKIQLVIKSGTSSTIVTLLLDRPWTTAIYNNLVNH
jgi:hypothetical protein